MKTIEESVAEIITEIRPDIEISTDAHFVSTGLLDSFDILSITAALDKSFGISIRGASIRQENFDTLAGIVALVKENSK